MLQKRYHGSDLQHCAKGARQKPKYASDGVKNPVYLRASKLSDHNSFANPHISSSLQNNKMAENTL